MTARGDKALRSVARSLAKRLGRERVTLFANSHALDATLTVGALVASGVARVQAVPCDGRAAPAAAAPPAPVAPAPPPRLAAPAPAPTAPPRKLDPGETPPLAPAKPYSRFENLADSSDDEGKPSCDTPPPAAPEPPRRDAAPAPAAPEPRKPRIETVDSPGDVLGAVLASLAAFAPKKEAANKPEPKPKPAAAEPRACPGCGICVYRTSEGHCLGCGASLSGGGEGFKRGFLEARLEGPCVVVAPRIALCDARGTHIKDLPRGALVRVRDDDGKTCHATSQNLPGLKGYATSCDLAQFEDDDDMYACAFLALFEAPFRKVERVWLRRRGPWTDEVLEADEIRDRGGPAGWVARCIKSGRAGAVYHSLQECEPVCVASGKLRNDELQSDDEADARGCPSNLTPWHAALALCADVARGWRPAPTRGDVWVARGEAAFALDKHAAAAYAFSMALCQSDEGSLHRARAAAFWAGRAADAAILTAVAAANACAADADQSTDAAGRAEAEGEPPRVFALVLGLLAVRDVQAAERRGASVAGEPWATILEFARRARVPDMLAWPSRG